MLLISIPLPCFLLRSGWGDQGGQVYLGDQNPWINDRNRLKSLLKYPLILSYHNPKSIKVYELIICINQNLLKSIKIYEFISFLEFLCSGGAAVSQCLDYAPLALQGFDPGRPWAMDPHTRRGADPGASCHPVEPVEIYHLRSRNHHHLRSRLPSVL